MLQLPRMLSRLCLSILSVVGFILQNVIFLIYMHYIVYAAKWYCKMVFIVIYNSLPPFKAAFGFDVM